MNKEDYHCLCYYVFKGKFCGYYGHEFTCDKTFKNCKIPESFPVSFRKKGERK